VDGGVENTGVKRYRKLSCRHLTTLAAEPRDQDVLLLVAETSQSHLRVAVGVRNRIVRNNAPGEAEWSVVQGANYVAHDLVGGIVMHPPILTERLHPARIVEALTDRGRAPRTSTGADLNQIIAAVVPPVVYEVLDNLDITALVLDRVDIDTLVSAVDVEAIVDRVDIAAIVERLDIDAIVSNVDIDAIVRKVNIDAIASQLDIDAIVSRVDVDTIVYQLDVDAIVPREARSFQGHRAGLVTRLAAGAIDVGVVILALVVCYFVVFAFLYLLDPRNFTAPRPSPALVYAVGALLLILYLAVSWMGNGRTYGDHVMGLRVVNRQGRRLHPLGALARAALYVIFPIGLLWVLISGQNRSLQDLVLRTSVIYDWEVHPIKPPLDPSQA
jgi:uncharacterized RDD family membrane protein YckC